jgi:hypothetical protein
MTGSQRTADDADGSDLGDALRSLGDSMDGLRDGMDGLGEAVATLQASTDDLCERQREIAAEMAATADRLGDSPASGRTARAPSGRGHAPADD